MKKSVFTEERDSALLSNEEEKRKKRKEQQGRKREGKKLIKVFVSLFRDTYQGSG